MNGFDQWLNRRAVLARLAAVASTQLIATLLARTAHFARNRTAPLTENISQHLTLVRGSINAALLARDGSFLSIGGDPRPALCVLSCNRAYLVARSTVQTAISLALPWIIRL